MVRVREEKKHNQKQQGINQTSLRKELIKKTLGEMIIKLEGDWDWCGGVGRGQKKDYQKLGTELLKEQEKLTNYFSSQQLQELKNYLERIKNNQVENMEKYQASSLCRELLEKC